MKLFSRNVEVIGKWPNEFQEIFVICCVHVILLKFSGLLKLLKCLKENLALVGGLLHFEDLHDSKFIVYV